MTSKFSKNLINYLKQGSEVLAKLIKGGIEV